jgi:DNA-directed RNA polymerase specialized sigma subunit
MPARNQEAIEALRRTPDADQILPTREYEILRLRAEGRTRREIGNMLWLSAGRIGQIEHATIRHLDKVLIRRESGTPEHFYRYERWGAP